MGNQQCAQTQCSTTASHTGVRKGKKADENDPLVTPTPQAHPRPKLLFRKTPDTVNS